MADVSERVSATIIERLARLGDGDAMRGFRRVCTAAGICSVCGVNWREDPDDAQCRCTIAGTQRAAG